MLSLVIISTEIFLLLKGDTVDLDRGFFVMSVFSFFAFFTVLEYLFGIFVNSSAASVFPLLPSMLLYLLLRDMEAWPYLDVAVIVAAILRIVFVFMWKREYVLLWGSFVLNVAALLLRFVWRAFRGKNYTDKLLFICLVVMTLAAVQKLIYAWKEEAFPFYYFALLGIIVLAIPMGDAPIDWTPVVNAGERLVKNVRNAADDVAYYLSFSFGEGSYVAGYSSLNVTGNSLAKSEKDQLILRTEEKPFYFYTDDESTVNMKMRRTVYLQGGRGADKKQLVSFIKFLYDKGVNKEMAGLFSQLSHIDIEYAYLDTTDEIVPGNSFEVSNKDGIVDGGTGKSKHKKGYSLSSRFIDIDYGSPYLIGLFRDSESDVSNLEFTYDVACEYVNELYGTHFDRFVDRQEFDEIITEINADGMSYVEGETLGGQHNNRAEYSYCLETDGASDRMIKLADEITSAAANEYDKCKAVEGYLRQYTYSTNAVGGHNPDSDMSTSEGMSDIADRFLFETEQGYCVHYTASMIMLLRLLGIPARACVGYRYAFPFDAQDEYVVSSNNAHIWPEAYLKNVGWVPFEPTSAYSTAIDHTWHRKAKEEPEIEIADAYSFEYPEMELPAIPEVDASLEVGEDVEVVEEKLAVSIFKIAWPVALSIVLLLILLVAGNSAITGFKYKYGTPEKKLFMDVEAIKKIIKKKAEDDFEDRGLLSDYLEKAPEDVRGDLEVVFGAYYRMIYAGDCALGISPEENNLAMKVREMLSKRE